MGQPGFSLAFGFIPADMKEVYLKKVFCLFVFTRGLMIQENLMKAFNFSPNEE